jgi:hypothetical protein
MEKENMDAFYAASRNAVVSTLTTLIQRDAGIIDRVSLTLAPFEIFLPFHLPFPSLLPKNINIKTFLLFSLFISH